MKPFLNAALSLLPLAGLVFGAGIVVIAFLDLAPSELRLAFTMWSLTCLAGWVVASDDLAKKDDE